MKWFYKPRDSFISPIASLLVVAAILLVSSTISHAADTGFCNSYANTAVEQNQRGRSLGIANLHPPVWSDNRQGHYKWCLTVSRNVAEQNTQFRENILSKSRPGTTVRPMKMPMSQSPQKQPSKQKLTTVEMMPQPVRPTGSPSQSVGPGLAQLTENDIRLLAEPISRKAKIDLLLSDPKMAAELRNLAARSGMQAEQLAHMSSSGVPVQDIPVKPFPGPLKSLPSSVSPEINWDKGVVFSAHQNSRYLSMQTYFSGTLAEKSKKLGVLHFLTGIRGHSGLDARIKLPKDMPPGTYMVTFEGFLPGETNEEGKLGILWGEGPLPTRPFDYSLYHWQKMTKIKCKDNYNSCGFVVLISPNLALQSGFDEFTMILSSDMEDDIKDIGVFKSIKIEKL